MSKCLKNENFIMKKKTIQMMKNDIKQKSKEESARGLGIFLNNKKKT